VTGMKWFNREQPLPTTAARYTQSPLSSISHLNRTSTTVCDFAIRLQWQLFVIPNTASNSTTTKGVSEPKYHEYVANGDSPRNLALTRSGFKEPRHTSTGTTIVGIKFKDGVILGADTRATAGTIVADKNCEKIHYIAPNIWYTLPATADFSPHGTAVNKRGKTGVLVQGQPQTQTSQPH